MSTNALERLKKGLKRETSRLNGKRLRRARVSSNLAWDLVKLTAQDWFDAQIDMKMNECEEIVAQFVKQGPKALLEFHPLGINFELEDDPSAPEVVGFAD